MRNIPAPRLKSGQIVLMGNLPVHGSKWVRGLIEERGCRLWLLPGHSPDLDPIEEAFSEVKGLPRKAKARTLELLLEATHRALSAITVEHAKGYFEYRGHKTPQVHPI